MTIFSKLPAAPKWIAGIILFLLVSSLAFLLARPYLLPTGSRAALHAAENGSFLEAARLAEAAAQAQPDQVDLWLEAGEYALKAGEPARAAGSFLQAFKQKPNLPNLLRLAQAYEQAGSDELAAQTSQSVSNQPDLPPEVLQWLLQFHLEHADYPAARAALVRLLEYHPQDASLYYQLGLLLAASDPEAARPVLRRAAELDPALQEAVRSLDDKIGASRRSDEQAFALLEAGRGLASLDEWELAAEAFSQAVQARPDFAEAWAFLGEARQQAASQPGAATGLAELEQALELDPDSVAAHTFIAFYWQRQQEPEKALLSMRAAVEIAPTNPILHVEMGKILARTGDMESALEAYIKAAELAPYEAAYQRMISEFTIDNEYQVRMVGLPAARQALLLGREDPQNLVNMARVLTQLEDLMNAERFLLQAIQVDPTYAPAHLQLGIVYVMSGDKSRGLSELETARSLDPQSETAAQAARLLQTFFP